MWDLWWTKWHWAGFLRVLRFCLANSHSTDCSTLISLWFYKENNKLWDCKKCIYCTYSPWAPHTYDFVVLTSLTRQRTIPLVVLQIGKAKDISAPLRIIRGWFSRPNSGRRNKWTQCHPPPQKLKKEKEHNSSILQLLLLLRKLLLGLIHSTLFNCEDGDSIFIWNVGNRLQDYTVPQPIRLKSDMLWGLRISAGSSRFLFKHIFNYQTGFYVYIRYPLWY
jgi:hypothetical protein